MEQRLTKIHVKYLTDNAFKLFEDDWMLITAGNSTSFNTMTASWGTLGVLWNRPIAICFIRPHRYTLEFMNKSDFFTLSFFTEKYRDALNYCGNHSGRVTDKIKNTGLTPVNAEHGGIYFSEARLMLECKKIYFDTFKKENFLIPKLVQEIYPRGDFHNFFVGEIITCLADTIIKEKIIKLEDINE